MTSIESLPMTSTQTLGDWLQQRQDGVPAELADHIVASLSPDVKTADLHHALQQLPAEAARRLRELLASKYSERSAALTLLSLDALVTYALEAIASVGGDVDTYAKQWINSVAEVPSLTSPVEKIA